MPTKHDSKTLIKLEKSTGCRWCDSHNWERCQCSDPDARPDNPPSGGRWLSPEDPAWWDLRSDLD